MIKKCLVSLVLVMAVALSACGGGKAGGNEDIDKSNKTILKIGVYNGGMGYQWAMNLKNKFENDFADVSFETGKTGVYVDITPKRLEYEASTLVPNIQSGNETEDIYYTAYSDNQYFYLNNVCADITPYLEADIYNANGEYVKAGGVSSILDKMDPYYVESFKQKNGKYYSVPYEDSILGFVYDHDLFISKKWLTEDKSGKVNYPQTIDEFYAMLDKIVRSGCIPFTYAPMDAVFYTSAFSTMLVAQHEGVDNYYKLFSEYGGNDGVDYTFDANTWTTEECRANNITINFDGTQSVKINKENAYLLTQANGYKYAIKFIEKLFSDNGKYIDPDLKMISQSFMETQKAFVNSSKASQIASSGKKAIAMILEGEWWENEARQFFNDMETVFGKDYAYGKRDFRYMPIPSFEGSKEDKNVITSFASGSTCFVNANSKAKDLAGLWLQYSLSESALEAFTMETGCVQAYDFDLSDTQKSTMTPFAQNVYSIKMGDSGWKVLRTSKADDLKHFVPTGFGSDTTKINGNTYNYFFETFRNYSFTSAQVFAGMKAIATKESWALAYQDYLNEYGQN